jgi:nucleotidyltransferase/DNA polymerase involved in DNA repair
MHTCIRVQEVDAFLVEQPVDALPGVGWAGREKLMSLGITTVAQLRVFDEALLADELGAKSAEDLRRFAWGCDDRQVRFMRKVVVHVGSHPRRVVLTGE